GLRERKIDCRRRWIIQPKMFDVTDDTDNADDSNRSIAKIDRQALFERIHVPHVASNQRFIDNADEIGPAIKSCESLAAVDGNAHDIKVVFTNPARLCSGSIGYVYRRISANEEVRSAVDSAQR